VTAPLLTLSGVRAGYGPAVVLDGISFELPERGGLAVLGRNGVGKSTLLLTIMGYTQVGRGRVVWRGEDITARPPHRRAQAGIGWVAQEREIFSTLTVEENLTVAARDGRWDLPAVYDLFPRIAERRRNFGNQLSGGEQQMLAIARALMTNPALLLLDEPLEGASPHRRRRARRSDPPHDQGRHLRLHSGRAARRDRVISHADRAPPRTRPHRPHGTVGAIARRPRHA
jgi:branched-chain amino acid transport system ATP-binding protein